MVEVIAIIRDIVIILAALTVIAIGIVTVVLLFAIKALLGFFKDDLISGQVTPLLKTAQETSTNIKGSADFMTTTFAMPLIKLISLAAAANRFIQILFGKPTR